MKIAISGITGKMGREIASLILQEPKMQVVSGLVRADSNKEGLDIGELLGFEKNNFLTTADIENFVKSSDAVIDFSSPDLSLKIAEKCALFNKILVCGTTGFSDEEKQKLIEFSKKTVIIWSANMSPGINILMNLVEKTAKVLDDNYDVEIVEMHHNKKIDAPSGTALLLGSAVAKGREIDFKNNAIMARFGKDAKRKKGEIGFATLRGGDVIGDHTVIFASDGERIELAHKASRRDIFAKGAIRGAIWGLGGSDGVVKKSGFYSMRDVFSISD